ncbi:MAG: hypothetical protein RMA76_30740 [Deltaproteobacteria bacterium]|jgi:hypothetical protein
MVLRPGLDLDRGFDAAGYFRTLAATLERRAPGAAPGASSESAGALASPAERARCFMQQWLDRTAARTPWGARPTALSVDEAEELLVVVEELGRDPVRAVRGDSPQALELRAATLGLTVADLVQLVTTDMLTNTSGGAAPAV